MEKITSITAHERGWALLRKGVLMHVYPSRHLAAQAAERLELELNTASHGKKLQLCQAD